MLGTILAGIILGGLIGIVISFVILKIGNVITRFKEKQAAKTRAKDKLTTILGDPAYVSGLTSVSIDQLEKMMGTEGLFEVPIINDTVDVDNIAILKTDERDAQLDTILKNNGGVIKLTA